MKTVMMDYHLNLLKSAITFQIVFQDDKINSFLKKERVFTASNGWRVISSAKPEILVNEKIIYVRGTDDNHDLKVVRVTGLGNDKEVKKLGNNIDQALGELCVAASGNYRKRPIVLESNVLVAASLSELFDGSYGNAPKVFVIRR